MLRTRHATKRHFKIHLKSSPLSEKAFSSFELKSRHFLDGSELNAIELRALLDLAKTLKVERAQGHLRSDLFGKSLVLIFDKPSLRTRLSFSIAMKELGGDVFESQSLNRKFEEPKDFIRVLNGYAHGVMVRTFGHEDLQEMANFSKIPIINGLTDMHHPCQALADFLTMEEKLGDLRGCTLAYVGDGNNVLHSLMMLSPLLGVNLRAACPKGYQPEPELFNKCQERAQDFGTTLSMFENPKDAVHGAQAIYTDVWTSMGFEGESLLREEAFQAYQVNAELHSLASPGALVMHCLPMVRGKEIADDMADHPSSVIFQQSENRLHLQKALLLAMMK